MLKRDNDTRWNSWLVMLESAIDLENQIRVFIDKNYKLISKNNLNSDEWETIRETINILQPFQDTTKALEGDKTTLDEVLQSMDFLINHVKNKQEEHAADQNLSASLSTMWFAFDKYYQLTDKTPAYAAALLLNPTCRRKYFDDNWQYLEQRSEGTVERAIDAARKLWQKEYKFQELKRASSDDEFERFINVSTILVFLTLLIFGFNFIGNASAINYRHLPQLVARTVSTKPLSTSLTHGYRYPLYTSHVG